MDQPQRPAIRYVHPLPPSSMAKAVSRGIRLIGWKRAFLRKLGSPSFVDAPAGIPWTMRAQHRITVAKQEGRRVWTIAPRSGGSGKVLLYLHGGAYVRNLTLFHWMLIGELVGRSKATVVVPDYPLAPAASYIDTYAFVQRSYADLLMHHAPEQIIFMGDSAGGGLALGVAQALRAEGKPLPARLILIAPWLDVTLTDPALEALIPLDHMLDVEAIRSAGLAYAAGADPRDPMVSPLYGDLEGLPPIALFVGTHDLLLADARALVRRVEQHGLSIDLFEYPGMFHVWVAVTMLPEAKHALERIVGLVDE